jgi:peptidyl-prolyl cis-trans isomerase C
VSGNATCRPGAVLVLLLLLGALPCPAGAARKAKAASPAVVADTSRVLFHIGDQVVTTEDVRQRLEEIPEAARGTFTTPEGRQQLLDRIVEERVWLLSAVRSGVPDRPQVKQQLAQSRRDLLIRTYLNEVMAGNPAPTDSEVSAYYAAHGSDYRTPASVTLRHIQTATESQARQVLKLARSGQDWAKLVQKYSADTTTRGAAGMLGTVTRDGLFSAIGRQPALAESALALHAGAIGGPYHTDRGWHVIKVDEVRPESTRPLENVRSMIQRILGNQRGQDYYKRQLEEMRRKLGVTEDSAAVRDFVSHRQDAHEMFKSAQELGPPDQRLAAYQQLLEQYPDSDVSPQAQFMVGFIYSEELKNYDAAEKAFRTLLQRYPKSELATSAQWMVDHMRSEEAPPFDVSEGDSSKTAPRPQGAGKGSSEKP